MLQYVVFRHYGKDDDTRFELGTCFSTAISNLKALFAGTCDSAIYISFV
jgi:hypothetical protein